MDNNDDDDNDKTDFTPLRMRTDKNIGHGMGRYRWAERVPRLELAFVSRGQFGRRQHC